MSDNTGMFAAARLCCIDSTYANCMADEQWVMLAKRSGYEGEITPQVKASVIGDLRELETDYSLRVARAYFFGAAA